MMVYIGRHGWWAIQLGQLGVCFNLRGGVRRAFIGRWAGVCALHGLMASACFHSQPLGFQPWGRVMTARLFRGVVCGGVLYRGGAGFGCAVRVVVALYLQRSSRIGLPIVLFGFSRAWAASPWPFPDVSIRGLLVPCYACMGHQLGPRFVVNQFVFVSWGMMLRHGSLPT